MALVTGYGTYVVKKSRKECKCDGEKGCGCCSGKKGECEGKKECKCDGEKGCGCCSDKKGGCRNGCGKKESQGECIVGVME